MYPEKVILGDKIDEVIFSTKTLAGAYNLASWAHKGQKRKSGEPYFYHCVEVMRILSVEWGIKKQKFLSAALLHDAVEDGDLTLKEITEEFGKEVAELVDGVTKLKSSSDKDTLKKVLTKTYLNPGVAVIKLADRLHNMRTLKFMSREKQVEKSKETIEAYTKLAESLGMWLVKTELEDLAFRYLDPKKYFKDKKLVDSDPRNKKTFQLLLLNSLQSLLLKNKIKHRVEIRKSGIFALDKKRERLSLLGRSNPDNFSEINDLLSIRIILRSIRECYKSLYLIHRNLGEIVDFDRLDEFVGANSRINGYQAIQTTLNLPQGPVEIALVTPKMEEYNKWGVVEKIRNGETDLQEQTLKLVFTPSNKIRFLPKKATGVDFALQISKNVLTDAVGMKIDGKKEKMFKVIPNSATIEIVLGEAKRAPMPGAERHCLAQTRKVIADLRRLEAKDKRIQKGRKIMEEKLKKRGLLAVEDLGDQINPVLYSMGCQGVEDLYFMVGSGILVDDYINTELDKAGICKEDLKITTIRLEGKDQPGILFEVVRMINQKRKNIKNIYFKNNGNNYELRLLVKDLAPEDEIEIKKNLKKDKRFSKFILT